MGSLLSDQAYQQIRRDIIQCVLQPGWLVAQSQLVERYHLSVTPVREALKRLEQEGYVQSIPRFGYRITPITVEDIENIYELRLLLEIPAVRLAVQRASDAQLEEIKEHANFSYIYKDNRSYREFLLANVDFHTRIAMLSGNRKLGENVQRVLDEMTRIFHLGLDVRDSAEEMKSEHIQLVQALIARNAHLAEKIMEDQIRSSKQRVLDMLNQGGIKTQTTFSTSDNAK